LGPHGFEIYREPLTHRKSGEPNSYEIQALISSFD
jgi:hypothetical protein